MRFFDIVVELGEIVGLVEYIRGWNVVIREYV